MSTTTVFLIRNLMDERENFQDDFVVVQSGKEYKFCSTLECVWQSGTPLGTARILSEMPLYRNRPAMERFFKDILGVKDAQWIDYTNELIICRRDVVRAGHHRIKDLYRYIEADIGQADRSQAEKTDLW